MEKYSERPPKPRYTGEWDSGQNPEIKLRDYIRIILQYKWLIIIIFLLTVAVATIYTNNAPRIYNSSGKILLEQEKRTDLFLTAGGMGTSNLSNQIEFIKSTSVMTSAGEKLRQHPKAANFPILASSNPVSSLAGKINLSKARDMDIITISCSSTDPSETQAAVNAVISAYQEENLKYAKSEVTTIRKFLEKQLNITSKKLAISEEDLREYKIENKIFSLSGETEEMIRTAAQFEAKLSEVRTDLHVASETLNYLKTEMYKLDETLSEEIISISSPVIEQLRINLIHNESRLAILLSKKGYTVDHPELASLQQEIENIKLQMRAEIDKILQVKEATFNPLDKRRNFLSTIISVEADYISTSAKKTAIEQIIEKYAIKMSGLPDAELELARLERAKAINEQVYGMLITRYEEAKISEEGKVSNIRILKTPHIPSSPISPKVNMNIMVSIVLGLIMGVSAAFLLETLNTKISTLADIERYVKLPVLGTIPNIPIEESELIEIENEMKMTSDKKELKKLEIAQQQMTARLVPQYKPKSPVAEAYRTFRTNIVSLQSVTNAKIFLITSPGPKEGKTTTSSNLAITLAHMGSKVLLLDCDMRRPMIHNLFYLERKDGLAHYLRDKNIKFSEVVKASGIPNLYITTSGIVPANPSELLASHRMDEFLEEARNNFDYIIVDVPPIIVVTDALIMCKKVDRIILVVRTGYTDTAIVDRGKMMLNNIGLDFAGVLVNGMEVKKYYRGYNYYYYYYYYYYDEKKDKSKRKSAENAGKS